MKRPRERIRSSDRFRRWALCGGCIVALTAAAHADPTPASRTPGATSSGTPSSANVDDLYQAGQQLFDQLAPPEVKAQYEFPTKEQWDAFAVRLQRAIETGSFDDLAAYVPEARAALAALRASGGDDDLADWLEQRLDELEAAQQVQALPRVPSPPSTRVPPGAPKGPTRPARPPTPAPPTLRPPALPPSASPAVALPYYDLWLARVKNRPMPSRAAELMPILRRAFAAEGVPAALAWLAEGESSLNPTARSPSGAKGLFQLMPETARTLGLGTFLPDQRTDPEKSARAAARYLRELHGEFGSWPLALAAYNAGAGRVSRALAARHAKDYAGVADSLPAQTRMYVPKICALVAVRSGESVTSL